jgi:hypothetical protein
LRWHALANPAASIEACEGARMTQALRRPQSLDV